MDNISRLVESATALGAASVLEQLGITAGELSQRQALKTYGKWLATAINLGRIHPSRVEDGRTGTRWYRVVDILTLKTKDAARAELHQRFITQITK